MKNNSAGSIFDKAVMFQLWKFVKPYKFIFFLLTFLTVFLAFLGPIRPYLIQQIIDNDIANHNLPGLVKMTIILIGLVLFQAFSEYLHTYLAGLLGQNVIRDLRIKLFNYLLSLRLRFFDITPIGRLVTRTISDIEAVTDIFSEGIAAIIGDILQIIVILGVMFYTNWKLTLVSLSLLPFLFISTYIFKEKVKKSFNDVRTAVANLNTFVQEHITGMNIVQIFNAEKRELANFEAINKEHRSATIRSIWYYSVYFPVAEVIAAACTGLLVWYGAGEVMNESVTLGMLISFIMYLNMFFRPVRMIADRFNTLQMGIVSAERVLSLLNEKEYLEENGLVDLKNLKNKPDFKFDIEFTNVQFSYLPNQLVLNNVSFTVKQGTTLAIVGATGAGKSSIINLLNRFYTINSGSVKIGNTDIYQFSLESLRNEIGIVLQDVFLFSDTIFNNITLNNKDISLDQVKRAADLVGATEFIEKLPTTWDYNVMERGATLSLGQRQLISFVRAMVYDPQILILDEATASIDTESEEMIQKAILNMMKNRTSIVIAHRLSTIQNATEIVVLEKGVIVEKGTHKELLELNDKYAKLYKMQF